MSLINLPEILLSALTFFYCAVIIGLVIGMRRVKFKKSDEKPFVSVIVAARNEEQTIGRLLEQLVQQSYVSYEVIIADDRSTDGTKKIIEEYQLRFPHLVRLVEIQSLSSDMPAKKHALSKCIERSNGEILCFTDADCVPPKEWMSNLVAAFDTSVGMVAGYSPYDESLLTETPAASSSRTFFMRFIEYEELKGAAWSAGSIGLNNAWLCTGRSLAYRRAVYDQVGGFEKIKHSISGDDDLFLQLVRRETSWAIRYVTDPASHVRTVPPSSVGKFIRQRTRHFSAGRFFPPSMKAFFFLFHLSNLMIFGSLIASLVSSNFPLGLWLFDAKLIADFILFAMAASVFRQWRFGFSFLLMEILYIFYNTFIGPLGFITKVEWKESQKA